MTTIEARHRNVRTQGDHRVRLHDHEGGEGFHEQAKLRWFEPQLT